MKTKLILAFFLAAVAAVFPQSALAYGAVWKYGGNWGHGKGVGAVGGYETQHEAGREALKQCEKERPHWAKKNTKYGCKVVDRFQNKCITYMRFAIQGVKEIPNPDAPDAAPKTVTEPHSSIVFYAHQYDLAEARSIRAGIEDNLSFGFRHYGRYACPYYTKAQSDLAKNSDPKYRNAPHFRKFYVNCKKPTHKGVVCDSVGYEGQSAKRWAHGRDQSGNEVN
ncbi:MAG: DUF4189 domain-containing protein [Betaproteobacteria bacterium]|nr:DUF4189 domain-containing protein [Betaproteobacteria bacterium]